VLAEGLRQHGFSVVQCVEPAWGSTEDRVAAARGGIANPGLAARLLRSYARLVQRLSALQPPPDVLIAGYPGQLDALLLRSMRPRIPIILDAFIALDETLADRGIGGARSRVRLVAGTIDRLAFRRADRVIVDTAVHARRFASEYGLSMDKVVLAPVGAFDPGLEHVSSDGSAMPCSGEAPAGVDSSTVKTSEPLRVLYFGGFIPLHGVPVILDAARHLGPAAGIHFELVGDGQDAESVGRRVAAEGLDHVSVRRAWMPESELIAQYVASADVCLGIFANRPKTLDVVPAKLYLALACARPVVTGDTPAVREELLAGAPADEPPVLVCAPGDGRALAEALIHLRDDAALRSGLARRGRRAYEQHFAPAQVVAALARTILELSGPR